MKQLTIFDIISEREIELEQKPANCHGLDNVEPTVNGYSPGHPWYYKFGGRILTPDEIKTADFSRGN